MNLKTMLVRTLFLLLPASGVFFTPCATKLSEIRVLDKDYLLVHFLDGEVTHRDDGKGPTAFTSDHDDTRDTVKTYGTALSTSAAATPATWTIKSSTDANFGAVGKNPTNCFRKTKLNGHAEKAWAGSDYQYQSTYEHFLYLKLPIPSRRATLNSTGYFRTAQNVQQTLIAHAVATSSADMDIYMESSNSDRARHGVTADRLFSIPETAFH